MNTYLIIQMKDGSVWQEPFTVEASGYVHAMTQAELSIHFDFDETDEVRVSLLKS